MRHIPEEELHAYLDQGLSRTQCVEIERHLAVCPSCQATRDGIAALRDRTTALLSTLAPPRTIPASFESLRDRADRVVSARRRRAHVVAWAASLVLAVGIGWGGSMLLRPRESDSLARVAPAPARPSVLLARTVASADTVRAASAPLHASRTVRRPRSAVPSPRPAPDSVATSREAVLSVLNPTPAPALTEVASPRASGDELSGMWRTMSWDGAQAEVGKPLPHIDGLPIVQVQVQNGEGARPLMVVAQQLTSGQVIRTIEGSANDVSQLLSSRRAIADVDSARLRGDSSRQAAAPDNDHSMAMQFGDRMLAITGDLPSDSLRAMIRRLNAEMRAK